jgi:hypothetical protein
MRKVCLFATQHQFQLDSPMDSAFDGRLRELIQDHKVDCILEEATGVPPKSCVELLADELKIHWDNMDLSVEERKNTPDAAPTSKYDTLQDLTLHDYVAEKLEAVLDKDNQRLLRMQLHTQLFQNSARRIYRRTCRGCRFAGDHPVSSPGEFHPGA